MKKLISLIAIFFAFACNAQTWPSGNSTALTLDVGGTTSLTITNKMQHVASIPTLTANLTINVAVSSQIKAGAIMLITVKTTSTETTTYSGSIVAPVVTGVAGKTWSQAFIYNGTNFYPCRAKIQVD